MLKELRVTVRVSPVLDKLYVQSIRLDGLACKLTTQIEFLANVFWRLCNSEIIFQLF